jgi:hypothetical protein
LGSIFGTDDDDRIGLVEGSHLRRIDGCSHYERDSVYLVFPPSHSYLITSATGWIRLKNSSDAHHVELLSWPRKGERPLGRFTLAPGQEEVFDYRVQLPFLSLSLVDSAELETSLKLSSPTRALAGPLVH